MSPNLIGVGESLHVSTLVRYAMASAAGSLGEGRAAHAASACASLEPPSGRLARTLAHARPLLCYAICYASGDHALNT